MLQASTIEGVTARQIAELQWEIDGWLTEVWPPGVEADHKAGFDAARILASADHPFHKPVERALRRLRSRRSDEELGALATAFWFNRDIWPGGAHRAGRRQWAVATIIAAALLRHPPRGIVPLLEARIRDALKQPPHYARHWQETVSLSLEPSQPELGNCLSLLMALPASHATTDLIERLALGEFDAVLEPQPGYGRQAGRAYELHTEVRGHGLEMVRRLRAEGRLTFESFCRAAAHLPNLLQEVTSDRRCGQCASCTTLLGYTARLAEELVERLTPENHHVLKQINGLTGPRCLVAAARHHARLGVGPLVLGELSYGSEWRTGIDSAVVHLARAAALEPADEGERAALLRELRQFPVETLKALLPVAIHGRRLLCEALDWMEAIPLVEEIVRLARLVEKASPSRGYRESEQIDDSSVDPTIVREVVDAAGASVAKEILALYRKAKVGGEETAALIEAAMGWSIARVERGLYTRNTNAFRAYALLPLTRGEEEVQERYLRLRLFEREGAWFPGPRRTRERNAVQAALKGLALNAGYPDATRLEWAMEARLAHDIASVGRVWELDGEYRVELTLDAVKPRLVVSRGSRKYKAVPPAVRRAEVYPEIKEAVEHLRGHATRVRKALEAMLVSGEEITRGGLAELARLPVVATMVRSLVGIADGETLGWIDPDSLTVATLDGTAVPVRERLRLAHPYDLQQAGELAAWQAQTVARRIVQPFKQVFRELYVLTPAELEAGTVSRRFAGHALDARIVARLLDYRGWKQDYDSSIKLKPYPALGLQAAFDFTVSYEEGETRLTSESISFVPRPWQERWSNRRWDARLPLAGIPPLVFSEVMRDADLAVSVAQRGGEVRLTNEAYERRAEVVRALVADLGLTGVTAEGHYARVRGSLAAYRIHLGSGAIHIEPGNYLCIVPDGFASARERVYLPFAADEDAKVSEIVSKVLLLANDHTIKDESILRQIRLPA